MYLVDKDANEAKAIQKKTFSELGFTERKNLQEWICKNPNILGEGLLIIQKEFDGFSDTNERLDLLALDKEGNIVLIENKLDDSGRDVVWQSIKYAAYCSTLTTKEIITIFQQHLDKENREEDAEELISNFVDSIDSENFILNSGDQRLILVAANFRKEVTATAMWLMAHDIKVKCIKITPYQHGDDILLDTEQIIPVPDTEEYIIRLQEKERADAKPARWTEKRFMEAVQRKYGQEGVNVYSDLLNKMKTVSTRIEWGEGKLSGSYFPVYDSRLDSHWIYAMWTGGTVEIQFQHCREPFKKLDRRKELRDKLSVVSGKDIPDESLAGRPSIQWEDLRSEEVRQKLVDIFQWYIDEVSEYENSGE